MALATANKLGSALFQYLLLMVETCYYKDEDTQYDLFMYGIHKSMIWLLSGVGNSIHKYTFAKGDKTYQGSLSWEGYKFEKSSKTPKEQILDLVKELAAEDPKNWGWAIDPENANYYQALPNVGLDHSVEPNVPSIPAS